MYENIILIPYRNREKHLNYFIQNTIPLIQKLIPNTLIVIIEQEEGKLFNRGCILNVGFKEYQNKTKYFITQDVDINPTKLSLQKYYNQDCNDIILGILVSPSKTLGGITKISNQNIFKMNGFPNNIWGWGVEDKALENRRQFLNIKKTIIFEHTNKKRDDQYFKCYDDISDRKVENYNKHYHLHYQEFKNLNHKQKEDYLSYSGLNNLNYNIIKKVKINNLLEIIKVSI